MFLVTNQLKSFSHAFIDVYDFINITKEMTAIYGAIIFFSIVTFLFFSIGITNLCSLDSWAKIMLYILFSCVGIVLSCLIIELYIIYEKKKQKKEEENIIIYNDDIIYM